MAEDYLDQLLSLPIIIRPIVSRDGKKVVFAWKNVHQNVDVFKIDLENDEIVVLTKTPEMTLPVSFFPKNNAVIIYEDINRNERASLYKVEFESPLKMERLTDYNPPYFIRGGEIHPNEQWLIYGANYDFEKGEVLEPTWVYKHDLSNDEKIPLAKPSKPAFLIPSLSNNGDYVLYNRKELHPRGDQYWLVDIEGKEDREIINMGDKASVFAKWCPDNKHIVFLTDMKEGKKQNYYSLGLVDIDSGEIEWLVDDPKRNVEDFEVTPVGNYIVITEYYKARPSPSMLSLENFEETKFPAIKGNLYPLSLDYKGNWIALYYSSVQPRELIRFTLEELEEGKFDSLTRVWEKTTLKPEDLTLAEDFEWESYDGLKIHGWLYRPKKWNGKAVVYVHGGPTAHSSDAINPEIQYLVSKGFVVLDPNYRGSTGYGAEFEEKIREKGWGSDEQKDIWAGIEALIKQGLAKEEKIGITGTSYGGYSSWFGITKAPKRIIAAAVPICGMTDLVVDYYTTRPDLRPYSEQMLGGSPEEVPEVYYERSPINFVKNIKGKKLLIVQGAQDPNVTPKNVEEVKKKLEENEIEYEELIFEDEGHGIIKTKNQKILYTKIAEFFDKAL